MKIFDANKPMLTSPDRIYPGQKQHPGAMIMSVLPAWPSIIAGPGGEDDDDDETPIGDPPDDEEDFDEDDDDDDDEEPLQAAFCIAASPSAPGRGTMSPALAAVRPRHLLIPDT